MFTLPLKRQRDDGLLLDENPIHEKKVGPFYLFSDLMPSSLDLPLTVKGIETSPSVPSKHFPRSRPELFIPREQSARTPISPFRINSNRVV